MSNEILNDSNENNEKERLTIEKLRKFDGFENMSDNEADEMVTSLKTLSILLFESFEKHVYKTV